ncbi:MAG: sugar transferase [Thioalkalivibrio sp.]|nr:sugar transferase [Thioalkalivibrio sp.]
MNRLLALLALIALLPVILVIAVAVRMSGTGPVIYSERRLGRRGRDFRIYKFRTLRQDAANNRFVAPVGDERITPLGARLRRLHLDELPQLVNIIRGDMNFVGPRPARMELWSGVPAELRERLLAYRPGLTSPASLSHICEDEVLADYQRPQALYRDIILPAKAAEDIRYFESARRRDWKVIVRTFACILHQGRDQGCCERLTRLLEATQRRPQADATLPHRGDIRG